MKIYPKCENLKISMICCSLLGIFPWQFMFQDNKALQKAYAIYSKLMLGYYIFFLVTAYIELNILLQSPVLRMDVISANVCITFIYTITISRQLIMRFSPGFRNIIKQIIDGENFKSIIEDEETDKIEGECVENSKFKSKIYLGILFMVTMQYIIRPAVVSPAEITMENTTIIIKPLPLSSWFPFDEQTHYFYAYLWHIFDSLIGASFVTYTDIFMFNLIVYPTGQLKKLQHLVRNFEKYKQKFKLLFKIENEETASYITFLDFIKRHLKIMKYIKNFNEAMGTLMVFDFLQSSVQIASILTQVLGNKLTLILFVFVGTFFVSMILRLILYYYYANEVILLSENLAYSVWESNWYEQSRKVKYMMFIFMMRAQKPLMLNIGMFSVMSLQSFISILKATYSYIMLMVGQNK